MIARPLTRILQPRYGKLPEPDHDLCLVLTKCQFEEFDQIRRRNFPFSAVVSRDCSQEPNDSGVSGSMPGGVRVCEIGQNDARTRGVSGDEFQLGRSDSVSLMLAPTKGRCAPRPCLPRHERSRLFISPCAGVDPHAVRLDKPLEA